MRRVIGLVAVLGVVCAAAPGQAAAWWETQGGLAAGQQVFPQSEVAVGADGTEAVAWCSYPDRPYALEISVRPHGQASFRAPVVVPGGSSCSARPAVAVAGDGRVLVTWDRGGPTSVEIAADGTLGAEQRIDATINGGRPQPAFDGAGRATVVWDDDDGVLGIATRAPGGPWVQQPGGLPTGMAVTQAAPLVAATGDAVISWLAPGGDAGWELEVSERAGPTGSFSTPRAVATDAVLVDAAAADDGRIALLLGSGPYGTGTPRLLERAAGAGGDLAPVDALAAGSTSATLSTRDGHLELVEATGSGASATVTARTRTDAGWGTAAPVGTFAASGAPELATSPAGATVGLWHGPDPRTEQDALLTATQRPDGSWPALQALTPPDAHVRPQGVVDGAGNRHVATWTELEGTRYAVAVARPTDAADPPPPVLSRPRPTLPVARTRSSAAQADPSHTGRLVGAGVGPQLAPAWTAATGYATPYPVLTQDAVVSAAAGAYGPTVVAHRLTDGTARWTAALSPAATGSLLLAADGDRVFAVAGGDVYALDAATGRQLWHTAIWEWSPVTIFARDGQVLVDASGRGSLTWVLDAATGAEVDRLGGEATLVQAGPLLVSSETCGTATAVRDGRSNSVWSHWTGCSGGGDTANAFDGDWVWAEEPERGVDGWIYDAGTGQVLARFPGSAPAFSRTLAVDVTDDGDLHAADLRTLSPVWSFHADGPLRTAPLITDGTVLVASDTTLYAVDLASGRATWHGALAPTAFPPTGRDLPGLAAGNGVVAVPVDGGVQVFRSIASPVPDVGPDDAVDAPGSTSPPTSTVAVPAGTGAAPASASPVAGTGAAPASASPVADTGAPVPAAPGARPADPAGTTAVTDLPGARADSRTRSARVMGRLGRRSDGRLTLAVRIPAAMAGRLRLQARLPAAVARALGRTSVRLTRTARPVVVVVLGRPSRPVRPRDLRRAVTVRVLT